MCALWSEDDYAATIYDGLGDLDDLDESADRVAVFLDRVMLVAAGLVVALVAVAGVIQITRWIA